MRNTNYLTGNLFYLFLFLSLTSFSQTLIKDGIETQWNSGEITFHDGAKLKGLIRYNEINGAIFYQESNESSEIRTFTETRTYSLVLIDSAGKQRNFHSFPFSFEGKEYIRLFEVLKEFETWALLSARSSVEAIEGKPSGHYNGYGPRVVLRQITGIFIIDLEGNIELLQTTAHREVDGLFSYSDDNSKIKKKLLKKYTEPHFESIEKFVKDNKMMINKRENLLKALDYYETLVSTT